MKGRRVLTSVDGWLPPLERGDYGRVTNGSVDPNTSVGWWQVRAPDGSAVCLNPKIHMIIEHPDGSISVRPSIVTHSWHGWLDEGEWKSV